MSRYIDADKFEKECMFDKNCNDMQDVIYKLRDHPAADVVEVVRCRDCKHRKKNTFCLHNMRCEDNNGFCSYGERKES